MKQDRDGSSVLQNAFVAPPRTSLEELRSGARFLLIGPKGSGKTTLLLHLKRSENSQHGRLILFKSSIRAEDRANLDKLTEMIFLEDAGKYSFETDYRTIWEWYILKNFLRLLSDDDVLSGNKLFKDMVLLLEADSKKFSAMLDSIKVDGAKGNIKLSVGTGALQTEIGAEINARRVSGNQVPLLDLVRLVQGALPNIRLRDNVRCRLYFDELEFALEKCGSGERDRRMVRDLIFAIYRTNLLFQDAGLDALCYAAIRSEVIHSFPGSTQEVNKITRSFGVTLSWEPVGEQKSAILDIFERKIIQSEIEELGGYSENPLERYFPSEVGGKPFPKYILDMGGHRPRGVLLCLTAAADRAWGETKVMPHHFEDDDNSFGNAMLDEFREELSATLFEEEVDLSIALLRAHKPVFGMPDFRKRMSVLNQAMGERRFDPAKDAVKLIQTLYRVGIIGNTFFSEEGNHPRQTWANRGYFNPSLDKNFVVHPSVQKVLQTT
nr:ATP-binding cassette domain-containing protein [Cereibacter sphaeroides]